MDEERAARLAAMYQSDDYDDPGQGRNVASASNGRTRKIRVGVIEYEVPTPEYVYQLEQIVQRQSREIAQLRQSVARLMRAITQQRHQTQTQNRDMHAIRSELDTKITRRDYEE